jgi:hypothetical protein
MTSWLDILVILSCFAGLFSFAISVQAACAGQKRKAALFFTLCLAVIFPILVVYRDKVSRALHTNVGVPVLESEPVRVESEAVYGPSTRRTSHFRVSVQAVDEQPTDTGADIEEGKLVTIKATGIVGISRDGRTASPDGDGVDCRHLAIPVFRQTFPAPDLSCHSLIGEIGRSGLFFKVGSRSQFRSMMSGRLYLLLNDNWYPDNSGHWMVEISVIAGRP